MSHILHDLHIRSVPEKVFGAITRPADVDHWWTLECSGEPLMGGKYRLYFGEPWDWRARVSRFEQDKVFEWTMTEASSDWVGTRVGFVLSPEGDGTKVRFYHAGWTEETEHFRVSSYCWAMLLRLLKVYVETGAVTPHAERALL